MSSNVLLFRWLAANVVGFVVGSLLGATNDGVLVGLIPGRVGVIGGDIVFGAVIGLAQQLALRQAPARALPAAWMVATAVGFAIGARLGGRFASDLAALSLVPVSTVFGLCMGTSLGLTTLPLLSGVNGRRAVIWVATNALAWILGEGVAFATGFSQVAVSAVALVIALVTWLGLTFVRPLLVTPAVR